MEGDVEQPLLQFRKKVYPNCPGCEIVQRHQVDPGPPVKELLVIALLVVCNSKKIVTLLEGNLLEFKIRTLQGSED